MFGHIRPRFRPPKVLKRTIRAKSANPKEKSLYFSPQAASSLTAGSPAGITQVAQEGFCTDAPNATTAKPAVALGPLKTQNAGITAP